MHFRRILATPRVRSQLIVPKPSPVASPDWPELLDTRLIGHYFCAGRTEPRYSGRLRLPAIQPLPQTHPTRTESVRLRPPADHLVLLLPDPHRRRSGTVTRHDGFATRTAAVDAGERLLREVADRTFVVTHLLTVAAFLEKERLPTARRTLADTTWQEYGRKLRLHALPRIGGVRLQQLQVRQLNTLYEDLLDHGRADGREPLSPQASARSTRCCTKRSATRCARAYSPRTPPTAPTGPVCGRRPPTAVATVPCGPPSNCTSSYRRSSTARCTRFGCSPP